MHVDVGNMGSEARIILFVGSVENQEENIETREQSGRQVDILDRRFAGVIATVDRVSSGQDRGTCVESSCNTCLGDRDSLLFHDLVNCRPVRLVHLVELIDTADTVISQNQRSSLYSTKNAVGSVNNVDCTCPRSILRQEQKCSQPKTTYRGSSRL